MEKDLFVFEILLTLVTLTFSCLLCWLKREVEELKKRVRYLEERDLANTGTLKKVCDYLREKEKEI